MDISSSTERGLSSQDTTISTLSVINNQNDTESKVPLAPKNHNSNQPSLSERDVKSVSCFTTVYNALKSCLEAIVSVFSYIFDKIGYFFTYILSKLLPQNKQDQETSVIPSNNGDYLAKEEHITKIKIADSFYTNDEASVYDPSTWGNSFVDNNNSAVDNQSIINEESIADAEPVANKESYQDRESSEEDQDPKVTADDKTQDQFISEKDKQEVEDTGFISLQVLTNNNLDTEQQPEEQIPNNTENDPSQEDLTDKLDTSMDSFVFLDNCENNQQQDNLATTSTSKTESQTGYLTTFWSMLQRVPQLVQNTLKAEQSHKCFDNFFKNATNNSCSIPDLKEMSAYSQEDFNTIFIEKVSYYLQNEPKGEPKASEVIAYIKHKINFINSVIRTVASTEPLEVKTQIEKCSDMMHTALIHYTKQQVKVIADDRRYFTADGMLTYVPETTISLLKKPKCSEETNHQFLADITRGNPKIKFFDNDKLLWDTSNPEALELTKKMEACRLELCGTIDKKTQEYSAKSAELKKIATEIMQDRRSKIQRFLSTDPEIVNLLLLEQTQAAIAVPCLLHINYCRKKLDDFLGEDQQNHIIKNNDATYEIEFHKKQDNKITIRVTYYGIMGFLVDNQVIDDSYNYEVITEVEYDLQNLANNRIKKGEIKLYPKP